MVQKKLHRRSWLASSKSRRDQTEASTAVDSEHTYAVGRLLQGLEMQNVEFAEKFLSVTSSRVLEEIVICMSVRKSTKGG